MKLVKFIYNEAQTPIQNAIDTVTMHLLAYGKLYELLHKQIWRKDKGRIAIATVSSIPTFNGRPVGFVQKWNIKSPSPLPYSYAGDSSTFGLNQLFMGQDYRKTYNGDPADGIYHDDCYITTKAIDASSVRWGYRHIYCVIPTNSSASYYYKEDMQGNLLINDITSETYLVGTIEYTRVLIHYSSGTVENINLAQDDSIYSIHLGIADGNDSLTQKAYSVWTDMSTAFPEHGRIVQQEYTNAGWYSSSIVNYSAAETITVFEDGTVIQYIPEHKIPTRDSGDKTIYAKYSILPMIYLDTGDLAMDRVEFVEKWDTYFELFVHEDSEWYSSLVSPFLAIVTVVVAAYTGILLNPLGAVGTGLSAFGTLSGNRNLSLIGGILMAGAGIYNAIEDIGSQAIENQAIAEGFRESYAQALAQNASFSELFDGFISNAGFDNWLSMGSKVFTIGGDLTGFSTSTTSTTTNSEETTVSKQSIYATTFDDRIFDPNKIINDVINIL